MLLLQGRYRDIKGRHAVVLDLKNRMFYDSLSSQGPEIISAYVMNDLEAVIEKYIEPLFEKYVVMDIGVYGDKFNKKLSSKKCVAKLYNLPGVIYVE